MLHDAKGNRLYRRVEIKIVYPDDPAFRDPKVFPRKFQQHAAPRQGFGADGIDDLLIQQIFLHRQPGFIRLIGFEQPFIYVEPHIARRHRRDLIMTRHERLKTPARQQIVRDAIRLVRRFDKKFANLAHIVALSVVCLGAHQFRGIKHGLLRSAGNKKARMPESLGCGRSTAAMTRLSRR